MFKRSSLRMAVGVVGFSAAAAASGFVMSSYRGGEEYIPVLPIPVAEAQLTVAEQRLINTWIKVGTVCLDAAGPYLPGSLYEDTPGETVVLRLLAEPDQPCGDTEAEIAVNIDDLSYVRLGVDQAVVDLVMARSVSELK